MWWFWSSSLSIRHFCKSKTMHNSTLHQHEQTRWQAFLLRMRISNTSVPDKFQRNSMCCLYLLWNSKLWKLQSKIWIYGRTQLAHSLILFSGKLLLIWYLWVFFVNVHVSSFWLWLLTSRLIVLCCSSWFGLDCCVWQLASIEGHVKYWHLVPMHS